MMVTGIVLSGIGGVSGLMGLLYYAMADSSTCDSSSYSYSSTCDADTYRTLGTVMLVSGGVMVAVGIPLAVIGARRVPARSTGVVAPPVLTARLGVGPGSLVLGGTW
jgi:hypothetical protein